MPAKPTDYSTLPEHMRERERLNAQLRQQMQAECLAKKSRLPHSHDLTPSAIASLQQDKKDSAALMVKLLSSAPNKIAAKTSPK